MFKNRSKRDFVTVLLDEEKEETKINVIGRITCCQLRIFDLSAEQIICCLISLQFMYRTSSRLTISCNKYTSKT